MDTSPHKSDFVNVNGIRLHYLDWGGNGPTLLFLAGMGCNAHIFDNLAPRFREQFHVLALTRRGHGQSDHPETGYDVDTLVEDIRQFLDELKIEKVILAGHSMAGVELSHFAALYPGRVLKLVFLDAAFDRTTPEYKAMWAKSPLGEIQPPNLSEEHYTIQDYIETMKKAYPGFAAIWNHTMDEHAVHELTQTPEGRIIDKMPEAVGAALNQTMRGYKPEDGKIQVPVLSFFTYQNGIHYLAPDWMTEAQQAQVLEFFDTVNTGWVRGNIEQFRKNVPHARIVEIPQGHHYCFIKKEELVFEEMRKFFRE